MLTVFSRMGIKIGTEVYASLQKLFSALGGYSPSSSLVDLDLNSKVLALLTWF